MPRPDKITPTCCESMWKSRIVVLSVYKADSETGYDESNPPYWVRNFNLDTDILHDLFLAGGDDNVVFAPKFCIFCGKTLPTEFERNPEPPKPICETDMYRCFTCGERVNCCHCYGPEFKWRMK